MRSTIHIIDTRTFVKWSMRRELLNAHVRLETRWGRGRSKLPAGGSRCSRQLSEHRGSSPGEPEGWRETSHGFSAESITDRGVPGLQPTTWHQILASETVTQPALHRRPQRLVRTDANSIPVLCLLGHTQCWAPRRGDSGKGASVTFSRPSSGLEPYSHLDL